VLARDGRSRPCRQTPRSLGATLTAPLLDHRPAVRPAQSGTAPDRHAIGANNSPGRGYRRRRRQTVLQEHHTKIDQGTGKMFQVAISTTQHLADSARLVKSVAAARFDQSI